MKKPLSVLLASLATLALAELAVRAFDVPPAPLHPLLINRHRLSDNPILGYEYAPTTEFDSEGRPLGGWLINRHGFRDREFEEPKPAGTYRILVLGDSTTAGNGVASADLVYTRKLEQRLNAPAARAEGSTASGQPSFEVLNFGVGGYHTLQEVETLRTKGLIFDPDLVLVTVCINDFKLEADGGMNRRLREVNPRAQAGSARATLWDSALRTSRLAFVLYHRLRPNDSQHDPKDYYNVYRRQVLRGRSPVHAGFELLSELQGQHGFDSLVVMLPEFGRPLSRYRSKKRHELVRAAVEEQDGLTFVDLLEPFAAWGDDPSALTTDGVHLTERGNDVLAGILLETLHAFWGERGARPDARR